MHNHKKSIFYLKFQELKKKKKFFTDLKVSKDSN